MNAGDSVSGRLAPAAAALLLAAVFGAAPLAATSYVMVSDGALADQATLIVEGRVAAVERAPAEAPSTDYAVEVDRVLKGDAPGGSIVVRILGGINAEGVGLQIWGAPQYRPGDRALLFLVARPDGAYAVLHFLLGAFHEIAAGGRQVVLRDLAGASEWRPAPDGKPDAALPGADSPRDLARFTRWLADRAAGSPRPADYLAELPAGALETLRGEFNLLVENGMNLRWSVFDQGGSATFYADRNGQPGLAGGGFTEYQNVLRQWTGAVGSPIRYLYGGTTSAAGGLKTFDSLNTILFDDPNHELASAYSCTQGGLLAISGPWFDPSTTVRFNGRTFLSILGADTITNAGIGCFFGHSRSPSKAAEELFGHELGHTLGLAHSCGDAATGACTDPLKNDALMRASIHDDGRGMRLDADDVAGVHFLYGPTTAPPAACTPSPTALCLGGRFLATLSWINQFNGTSGVGQATARSASTGFFSFGDPSNVELLVKVLDLGGVTKVFYGELTDLHFTLTVTDTETGDVKTYGNTAGDCGGIDESAFGDSLAAAAAAAPSRRDSGGEVGRSRRGPGTPVPERAAAGACRPSHNTLCLLNGRFSVAVDWSNPGNGEHGKAVASPLSKLVGTFYFSDPGNVELMTKLVPFPDRIAFFYGALSDLPYTIRVTDTTTGVVKTYAGAAGKLCGGLDDHAF